MKKCPKCNRDNIEDASFCCYCGQQLVQETSLNNQNNLSEKEKKNNILEKTPKKPINVFVFSLGCSLCIGGLVYIYRLNDGVYTNNIFSPANINDAILGGISSIFIWGAIISFVFIFVRYFITRSVTSLTAPNSGCGSFIIFSTLIVIFVLFEMDTLISTNSITRTPTATHRPNATRTLTRYIYRTLTPRDQLDEYWRIQPIHGAQLWGYDGDTYGLLEAVEDMARNLAIPEPFYWEWYILPNTTHFTDIEDHYWPLAQNQGYTMGQNNQGITITGEDTYLLSFIKNNNSTRIIIEFWPVANQNDAQLLIFYVNP